MTGIYIKSVSWVIVSFVSLLCNFTAYAALDEFDTSNNIINTDKIVSGGPRKDDIPAILKPRFAFGKAALFMKDDDLVVGVSFMDEAKAYPIKVLNWHEIVNDTLGGASIAVSWCPLTRSGIVFVRQVGKNILKLGVSGLLYNSNLVMYDTLTHSLWPQLSQGAVTGKFSGHTLKVLPSMVATWREWRVKFPNTTVLSPDTGFIRDYVRDPYEAYHASSKAMFAIDSLDSRLPPKTVVIGVEIDGVSKAYPLKWIKNIEQPLEDTVGETKIKIYVGSHNTAYIVDENRQLVAATTMYWFAWSAFHKNTLIFEIEKLLKNTQSAN
ncbi:MAG: DUF3179 domain-containing protein [Candidatus Omnitrophota bacterium]|nr:MAG: DUF3179 domain-containing protein [Candidatus Omnitrophota bacterium]